MGVHSLSKLRHHFIPFHGFSSIFMSIYVVDVKLLTVGGEYTDIYLHIHMYGLCRSGTSGSSQERRLLSPPSSSTHL